MSKIDLDAVHDSIIKVVSTRPMNRQDMARLINIPYQIFANRLNDNPSHKLGWEDLVGMIGHDKNNIILDELERQKGRVAIDVPYEKAGVRDVHKMTMRAVKEFGELMATTEKALMDDKLSRREKENIQKEGNEALQAIATLLYNVQ